eukprot:11593511-Prorocentrum_lima.AAC.1
MQTGTTAKSFWALAWGLGRCFLLVRGSKEDQTPTSSPDTHPPRGRGSGSVKRRVEHTPSPPALEMA